MDASNVELAFQNILTGTPVSLYNTPQLIQCSAQSLASQSRGWIDMCLHRHFRRALNAESPVRTAANTTQKSTASSQAKPSTKAKAAAQSSATTARCSRSASRPTRSRRRDAARRRRNPQIPFTYKLVAPGYNACFWRKQRREKARI